MNGVYVELITEKELKEKIEFARTASGRALWSPNTCVVDPKIILNKLEDELESFGVTIFKTEDKWLPDFSNNSVILKDGRRVFFKYLFNCGGLKADKIAHSFDLAKEYSLIPFKGLYWKISPNSNFNLNTNLYPVPDISLPFLEVTFHSKFG